MGKPRKSDNILVVMADQLTALAVGCYGNSQVKTPNMDRLAERGVVFENAYSSSPLCTPARYAFMTGQNISRCAGYDNAAYMPSTMPTFAHYLRALGYRTCLAGKMHFVGADQLHGFEERLTTDVYPADFGWVPDWTRPDERIDLWYHNMSSVAQAGVASITNQLAYDDEVGYQALRAIHDHARSTDDRPLCLVASFIHPHDPYATRQRYWDLYDETDIPLPSVPRPPADRQDPHSRRLEKVIALDDVTVSDQDIINARRAYFGNVSYVDEWLGRLLAALEEGDQLENTTVMFISDHGDMLGERGLWYKMSFLEWSNRIPLVVARPGKVSAGRVARPVAQVDVLPTLVDIACENARADTPDWIDPIDGVSLWPLCLGETDSGPDIAVSEYLAEGTGEPMLMLRNGRYKYIRCAGDPELLYDVDADPGELQNRVDDPALGSVLSAMRERADGHWDAAEVKQRVIESQQRRRAVHATLRVGRYTGWDFQPHRDAGEEYTRSHMDLTDFDVNSRYPRPKPFR